jgi:small GTP-binding protein
MWPPPEPLRVKVCFLGDPEVGKTSIISRWYSDIIPTEHKPTIGSALYIKDLQINGVPYKIELRDTAGQERYRSLTPIYLRNSSIVFVVYSIIDRDTFESVGEWIQIGKDHLPDAKFLLFGNKTDRQTERQVSTEEAQKFSEAQKVFFTEGSALTGEGINNAFLDIIQAWSDDGGKVVPIPQLEELTAGGPCSC